MTEQATTRGAICAVSEERRGTTGRRGALWTLGGAVAVAACGGARVAHGGGPRAAAAGERAAGGEDEHAVTVNEDLMREHGVLRRVLQVYDEVARRVTAGAAFDPAPAARASRLVRTFVEDYHERAEERWVFPAVAHDATLAALVAVLRAQHVRGRELTDAITRAAAGDAAARAQLAPLCTAFARMYRAHAAREDTVVFPALHARLGPHAYHELGEQMEAAEHATVGEGGFERAVAELVTIEAALGIADLASFTAAALTRVEGNPVDIRMA